MLPPIQLPDKEFFSMGEVSRIVGVPPHTLRYWEHRVGFPRPARRSSGHRRFTRKDLEAILSVKTLIAQEGLTTRAAHRALKFERTGRSRGAPSDGASREVLDLLREVRREINAMIQELK